MSDALTSTFRADPAAFRARALARLRGETVPAPEQTHKQALNAVRNGQRRRALTPWQWKKCLKDWGGRCAYCGRGDRVLHREHFVPVALGGTLKKDNIVPACQSCNNTKKDRDPMEWLAAQGQMVRYLEICAYLKGL